MKKRNKNNKSFLLLASLALIVTAVIGTTMAYLVSDTPAVTNTFTAATVDSDVEETFDGTTKENVKIQNTGDIKAFIRAKVVVTWQKTENGETYILPARIGDYSITYNTNKQNAIDDSVAGQWTLANDGFYYWSSEVPATKFTGILIESCSPAADKAPEGYNLHVEILAEAIQAEPANVVTDVWGFTPPTTNN